MCYRSFSLLSNHPTAILDDDMYDYGDESDDENEYAEEDEDSGQGEN